MARRKITRRKTRSAPKTRYSARSSRGRTTRRTARRSSSKRSSRGGGTIKLVIEQAPASNLSPYTQLMLEQGKVQAPPKRKAKF